MKKILSVLISLVLCISICGCSLQRGSGEKEPLEKTEDSTSLETKETQDAVKPMEKKDTADLAMDYLRIIGKDYTDRMTDSPKGDYQKCIDFIVDELEKAGYGEEQIEYDSKKSQYSSFYLQNIILSIPGKSSDKQIIVGGHFDGDGIGDNGTGMALLLAAAVNLSDKTPDYDVKLIFFDGEEYGLLGSEEYAEAMSEEEIKKTVYMINLDSLGFGDYCNIYGGETDPETGMVERTQAYEYACKVAFEMGIKVYGEEELNGYFKEHGTGPEIETNTLYTNPWTKENPAPVEQEPWYTVFSPSTLPASDHLFFSQLGIPYIYFEATNWFAAGDGGEDAYSGYFETYDTSLGKNGMFMNTKYDTLENLEKIFPGRALEHFQVYAPLLEKLILNPME